LPWRSQILDGLLGADVVSFQTEEFRDNFVRTCARLREDIQVDGGALVLADRRLVRTVAHPISIDARDFATRATAPTVERRLRQLQHQFRGRRVLLGVDRLDYTKGIPERFRALERFFELNPGYRRRFTFVQIGAPSRTDIERYKNFLEEASSEAERINGRFQTSRWKPIVFRRKHHSHEEISRFYRAASLCMVTSLHDGMNLVAKEFVASREDERGVLILSTFAGAAHELTDALLVNPYDISQLARAIHRALEMPEREQTERMQRMRHIVREHNVYRWAAHLLSDLTEIRIEMAERAEV